MSILVLSVAALATTLPLISLSLADASSRQTERQLLAQA
jgi:hypothetical protein